MLEKLVTGFNVKSHGISFITGFVICSLLFGTMAFASQGNQMIGVVFNNIKIVIDGQTVMPKDGNGKVVEPFIYNGTTYLPVRAVAEAVGKTVTWDSKTSTVYLGKTDGQTTVENLTNLPVFEGQALNFGSSGYTDNTGVIRHPAALVGGVHQMVSGYSGTYLLNTKYSRLKGNIALIDEHKNTSSKVLFNIYGDDKLIYTSKVITSGAYPQDFDVDISGVVQLRLETTRLENSKTQFSDYIILSGLDLYN